MRGKKVSIVIFSVMFLLVAVTFVTAIRFSKADGVDKVSEDNNNINNEYSDSANQKLAADEIKHGAILQAWCWSFNTIKEKLPEIKAAGYTAIQTSPIQECRLGENNQDTSLDLRRWYFTYQPVDFKIGNYQLGTKAELEDLCTEAKKYDVDIICDVVVNHMTSEWNYIKPNMQKREYFHTNYGITDWEDRKCLTSMALCGLWDLDTSRKDVQNIIKDFLKECIDIGVSGFRYDCAKHIELPEDEGFGSDFWPYIIDNGAKFQLGEVLKGKTARYDVYSKYLNVTAAEYGEVMQAALKDRDFSVGRLIDYRVGIDPDGVATWVESHDNFANDEMDSVWMTDEDIKLGWAAITAREKTTTVFYDRPLGAGGTTYDSRFPGLTQIGDAGSELYKDDEIVAVNIFRNIMEHEDEYMRNIYNGKILMIERGTKGAVIINLNDNDVYIESDTRLDSKVYENYTDDGGSFEVKDGKIRGNLPARKVVVLY